MLAGVGQQVNSAAAAHHARARHAPMRTNMPSWNSRNTYVDPRRRAASHPAGAYITHVLRWNAPLMSRSELSCEESGRIVAQYPSFAGMESGR